MDNFSFNSNQDNTINNQERTNSFNVMRNMSQTLRDIMIGYNNNLNTYNQNVSRFLSVIERFNNDARDFSQNTRSNRIPQPPRTIRTTTTRIPSNRNNTIHRTTTTSNINTPTQTTTTTTNTNNLTGLDSIFRNNLVNEINNHNNPFRFSFPVPNFLSQPSEFEDVVIRPTDIQINRALESFIYENNMNLINTRCPITLEEFNEGDHVRRIKHCGHTFRRDPINNWFTSNVRCPVCRFDIREYQFIRPIDISQNPTDISQNPTDISQNPTDISQNPVDISQNPVDISQNTTDSHQMRRVADELTQLFTTMITSEVDNIHNIFSDVSNSLVSLNIPITLTRQSNENTEETNEENTETSDNLD